MVATELRLEGRADLVERQPSSVVVRDLKTGRVVTEEGEILPHIERQMRLYGVIARRVWPDDEVKLVIDDGTEHEVSFDGAEEESMADWLAELLGQLPSESTVRAKALATPGEACEGCGFRHLCPTYRRTAPLMWQREGSVRMPLDTWGEIVELAHRSDASCDVTLIDVANRRVKVFGLLRDRVAGLAKGDAVWLFGLRTTDRRLGPEGWRQPSNFYEVDEGDQFARAWSLESFTGS